MSNNIKGITVEIGGNTGPLTSAMKGVNKAAGDLQSELREVNKQLKFDPKNTVLATQKIDLLKQSTQTLEEKQKTLKTAVEQAHTAFEKGDMGADKVRAVEREYEKVNSQLKETKKYLAAAEAESGTFTEKVKGKFSLLKDKIKDTFSAENIKAGIGAVGVAVGGFLKSSLDEAKDAESANASLAQSLKSTGSASGMTMESLENLSQSLSKNTTFSNDEVKSGESMLLTFTHIGKDVFPSATAAVLDFAQKMGKDPKDAAMTLGKALNDPTSGLAKLSKAGVAFTDQQKKQITAMQKVGDTAGAQKLMIADLNKAYGGQAAAAAETYEGKQKQLANTLKELKETIGAALLPALAKIVQAVAPIIEKIADFVQKNPQLTTAILAVIAAVGTLIGGMSLLTSVTGAFGITLDVAILPVIGIIAAIVAAVAVLVIGIKHLWDTSEGFRTAVTNIWNGIKTVISTVINAIVGFFTVTIPQARNSLVAFFAGVPAWWSNLWTQVGQLFTNFWNSIVSFFAQSIPAFIASVGQWFQQLPYNIGLALGTAIKNIINFGTSAWSWVTTQLPQIINGIIQWFQQLPGRIWTALTQVVAKIGQWITGMGAQVETGVPSLISRIGTWFSQLPGKIWTFLTQAVQKVKDWCANLLTTAGTEIPKFVASVVKFFQQLPDKMLDIGKNIVYGIWNGITGAASWLWGKVTGWCNSLVQGFKDGLGIHSPSKLFADVIGKNLALGIGQGFTDNMKSVTASMAAVIPSNLDNDATVNAAMAAARGAVPSVRTVAAEQAAATAAGTNTASSQQISLTVVTPDGRTLGGWMAPYVGKALEFNAKNLLPARG